MAGIGLLNEFKEKYKINDDFTIINENIIGDTSKGQYLSSNKRVYIDLTSNDGNNNVEISDFFIQTSNDKWLSMSDYERMIYSYYDKNEDEKEDIATLIQSYVGEQSIGEPAEEVIETIEATQPDYSYRSLLFIDDVTIDVIEEYAHSDEVEKRRDAARYEDTPDATLEELARDTDEEVRYNVAANENTSENTRRLLIEDPSRDVRSQIAKTTADEEILNILSQDYETSVKEDIAANPYTPEYILYRLANEENHLYVQTAAISHMKFPDDIREIYENIINGYNDTYESEERLKAVAENPNTETDILRDILKKHYSLREVVAGNVNTPTDILLQLSTDTNEDVRFNVAANENTPPGALMALSTDSQDDIRVVVAENPNTPIFIIESMLENHGEAEIKKDTALSRISYVLNTKIKLKELEDKMLTYEYNLRDVRSRYETYRIPEYFDKETVDLLRESKDKNIRQAVAGSEKASKYTLEVLSEDSEYEIRKAVATNPNTPPNVLKKLAKDSIDEIRLSVAESPNTNIDTLIVLAKDPLSTIRNAVCRHEKANEDILRKLSDSKDASIQIEIAKKAVSEDLLLKMSESTNFWVQQQLSENVHSTPQVLQNIINRVPTTAKWQLDSNIIKNIMSHPNTDSEILTKLSRSTQVWIRMEVAANPKTPSGTLKALSMDRQQEVKLGVLKNPKTPGFIIKDMAEATNQDPKIMMYAVKILKNREVEKQEMEKSSEYVKTAFENSAKIKIGGRAYQDIMLEQRVEGPTNAGSSYDMTKEEIKEAILSANWQETTHPAVASSCKLFMTKDIPGGKTGIIDIKNLPENTEFYAIDPKNTGNISIGAANVPKNIDDTTYLIVSTEVTQDGPMEVVATFHPGEPVNPSVISTDEISDGTRLTKEEVLSLGFEKAKYMSPEMVKDYEKIAIDYNKSGNLINNIEKDATYTPEQKSPSEQFFGEKMQIHEPTVVTAEEADTIIKKLVGQELEQELDQNPQNEATIARLTSNISIPRLNLYGKTNKLSNLMISVHCKIKEEQAKVQSVWDEIKSQLPEDVKSNTEICTHQHYNDRYEYIAIRTLDEEVQSLGNWHPDLEDCGKEEIKEAFKEKVIMYHEDSDINGDFSNEAVYHKNFDDLLRYHENILYNDAVNEYSTVPPEFSADIEEKYGAENINKVYDALMTFGSNMYDYARDLEKLMPDDTIALSLIKRIIISTESNTPSIRALHQFMEREAEQMGEER